MYTALPTDLSPDTAFMRVVITIWKSTVSVAEGQGSIGVLDVTGGEYTHNRTFNTPGGVLTGSASVNTIDGELQALANYTGNLGPLPSIGSLVSYDVTQTPNGPGSILESGFAQTSLGDKIAWDGEYLYVGAALPSALRLSLDYSSYVVNGNRADYTWTVSATKVPEPSMPVLFGIGMIGLITKRLIRTSRV